jgi:hypothetical protein
MNLDCGRGHWIFGGLVGAERGWIGEPQPQKEWHTPGWLSEKGTGHSHFHSGISTLKRTEEQERKNAELYKINHSHIGPLRLAMRYSAGRPRDSRRVPPDAGLTAEPPAEA